MAVNTSSKKSEATNESKETELLFDAAHIPLSEVISSVWGISKIDQIASCENVGVRSMYPASIGLCRKYAKEGGTFEMNASCLGFFQVSEAAWGDVGNYESVGLAFGTL